MLTNRGTKRVTTSQSISVVIDTIDRIDDDSVSNDNMKPITKHRKLFHSKYNNYIIFLWIASFNILGLNSNPFVIIYYTTLAIWTYTIAVINVGSDLIAELLTLKYTLYEVIYLLIVLISENALIYTVSFIDPHKDIGERLYDPIRDILNRYINEDNHPNYYNTFTFLKQNCFTTSSTYFITWAVILCFSAPWMKYTVNDKIISGAKLGQKILRSIAFGHAARTICFMLTVVPSQKYACFTKRFTNDKYSVILATYPDLNDLNGYLMNRQHEWSWQQMVARRPMGGCNDLIFSGHYIIIMNSCLFFNEVYGQYCKDKNLYIHAITNIYLWSSAIFSAVDMINGWHHYTVDVYLAILITILFWKYMSYPTSYWYIDLRLKGDSFNAELKKSWISYLFRKLNIDSLNKQRIFITVFLTPILLLIFTFFLPGS